MERLLTVLGLLGLVGCSVATEGGASEAVSGASGVPVPAAGHGPNGTAGSATVAQAGSAGDSGAGGVAGAATSGAAGSSGASGAGGELQGGVAGLGGAAAGAGVEICECSSGKCCDGCHVLPDSVLCAEYTYEVCDKWDQLNACASASNVITIYRRIHCSGLSHLCVAIPSSIYEQSSTCCPPDRNSCVQYGDPQDMDGEYTEAMPYAECI